MNCMPLHDVSVYLAEDIAVNIFPKMPLSAFVMLYLLELQLADVHWLVLLVPFLLAFAVCCL